MTPHRFKTELGTLAVVEDGGALVRLEWVKGALTQAPTPLLKEAEKQLKAYFAGRLTAFSLPLALEGTPFQKRVWKAMNAIPYGKTRTYGELARQLKSSPRAVGGACGANPIPVIVPCHRVTGAQGQLTGYSGAGGVETKAWLLRHEGAPGL
jgi:methylated-DNA-[protein]-cysteine S-methyltransferase